MQEKLAIPTDLPGVLLQPLEIIPTPGGDVLHMLKSDYALAPAPGPFGEIYFSEIYPGSVKAWKRHHLQTQRFAVPVGMIKIVLFDDRENSPGRGNLLELELGRPEHYNLLLIPPMIWYGFMCASAGPAIICNYADMPHRRDEAGRLPSDSSIIPFSWPPL